MNILVRKAHIEDASIIALLGRITFDETFGHLFSDRNDLTNYFEQTFSVKKITASLKKEQNYFWVASIDDLPVGYAKLKKESPLEDYNSKEVAQLQKIYVLKEFISLKIGTHLQDAIFTEVKKSNIKTLWLAVLYTNLRAINFYLKHGYQKTSKYYHSIGKEDFEFDVMTKTFTL